MQIIGIAGRAGSGKDTAAQALVERGFVRVAFADPVKDAAAAMFGVPREDFDDPAKKELPHPYWGLSPRQMAQKVGTEGGRDVFGRDLWVRRAWVEIVRLCEQTFGELHVVLTDVRFPNEAEFIASHGGTVIEIVRPGVKGVAAHSSETPLGFDLIDHKVYNDRDIEWLRRSVLAAAGFQPLPQEDV